ncbi:probable mediator of RNA polymerase II transcription subunit 26c [Miscanthus floridulus]|uniref:probable mediator of RNA polymerase II transcription subunit 26c n=1 Tax=Miscanthus floridulus TaxID=154761 RepID=UPI00345AF171
MSSDGRLRRALVAFGGGGDVWSLVDAALAAAARDSPAELRARRDGIVQRLYAGAARCHSCDANAHPPPAQPNGAVAAAAPAAAAAASPASPDEEVDVDGLDDVDGEADDGAGVESKILAIRDFLEDPDQSEDEMVSLLQNLADMDITYKALQDTDIGRHVNGLRKHPSSEVRQLVKLLVRKWKEIVDDWVRLHNSSADGGGSIISDGDSPDKVQPKYQSNTHLQASDFKYSPSPQRHNVLSSERSGNHNLVESTMEKCRTSPAPAYHNAKQNNSNNYSTVSSSAPARAMREQKNTLLDAEKLDSARKRLQENYQEAQNAKKQRTIQVMDIHDIPKPKNRNTFIRKGGGGGFLAKHR